MAPKSYCLIAVLLVAACGNNSIPEYAKGRTGAGGKSSVGGHGAVGAAPGAGSSGGRGGSGASTGSGATAATVATGATGATATTSNTASTAGQPTIGLGFDYIQLAAGERHNCARLLDGRVKCWGQNGGWLGIEDYLDRGDEPGEMGAELPSVDLGKLAMARSVATRDCTVCALLHGGELKCWGNNSVGELGQGDMLSRGGEPGSMDDRLLPIDLGSIGPVVEVAVGGNHVCVRTDAGAVYCWGNNSFGELGLGDTNNRGDEPGEVGDRLAAVDLGTGRSALQIAAGLHHNCAVLDDHSVKCWGENNYGQLGVGDIEWRGDEPDEMGDALLKVELGNGQLARAVFAGEDSSCAILEDRRVKCWGNNLMMQLGNGDIEQRGDVLERMGDALPYTQLGAGFAPKILALGSRHACALSTNGAVKCWGSNEEGQLGIGSTTNRGAPLDTMGDALPAVDFGLSRRAYDIAVGAQHSCATLDDGNVVCWGGNTFGQLGIGDRDARGTVATQLGADFVSTALD